MVRLPRGEGVEGGFRAIIDECQQRDKAAGCLVPAINTNQKAPHLIRTAVVADGLQSPTALFGVDIEQPPTSRSRKGDKEIEARGSESRRQSRQVKTLHRRVSLTHRYTDVFPVWIGY